MEGHGLRHVSGAGFKVTLRQILRFTGGSLSGAIKETDGERTGNLCATATGVCGRLGRVPGARRAPAQKFRFESGWRNRLPARSLFLEVEEAMARKRYGRTGAK